MGYNYCLVITKEDVTKSVIETLKKDNVSVELVMNEDGSDVVVNGCSLLSYHGREFPDLEEKFPGHTLTLYVDGRIASYEVQGNWELASSFNAGISLQMGVSLKSEDLEKIEQDKKIKEILIKLKASDTFDDLQEDDGLELQTHSITIESDDDVFKVQELSELLEELSLALVDKNIDHYVAWFEGNLPKSSGELDENLLYPVVYADAFWVVNDIDHQIHVTHTEIFHE